MHVLMHTHIYVIYMLILSLYGTIKLLKRKKPVLNIVTKPSILCNQVLSLNMARAKKCNLHLTSLAVLLKKIKKFPNLNKISSEVSKNLGYHRIHK